MNTKEPEGEVPVMPAGLAEQQRGFELLLHWSALISLLPLEEWQRALNHAETIGPILDPTLYQEYLHSPKPEILKDVLEAALQLKAAVKRGQLKAREMADGQSQMAKR